MKHIKRTIILLILIALSANSFCQEWQSAKDGPYTYRFVPRDPLHARFYTLKNGLTVILSVNKASPRIQTLIGTRAGSNNDPANHTGLAHYLEHLLFKGTSRYGTLDWAKEKPYIEQIEGLYTTYNQATDAATRKNIYHLIDSVSGAAAHYAIPNEYVKMMSAIGAQGTNAHTATEETVFEEDIPRNAVDPYLAVAAERFRQPVFRLFHTELEAVYEEKNRGLDNDGQKAYAALMDGLFPHTNYGQQTTIGTVEHLKNPSLVAIRQFYQTWYVPNNMAIVMAGDLDPSATIRKVDAAFNYMQAKPITEYNPAEEPALTRPIVRNVYGPDAESLSIAFRFPGVKDQRSQVLLEVLADLLSNGKTGLMDIDLNQAQLVQSAGAGNTSYRLYSVLQMNGKPKPGQRLEDLRDLLLGELAKIRQGDFDESLIRAIVENQKVDIMRSLANNNFRAKNLMGEFIRDRGEYWPENVAFQDRMLKVSKKDIIRFATRFTGSNYVIVFKHTGRDSSIVKVQKPAITSIYINKTAQSEFLKKVEGMRREPIRPEWVDYARLIKKGQAGPAKILYVHNSENSLFSLTYHFPKLGSWGDKRLPVAAAYLAYTGTKDKTAAAVTRAFYNLACTYNVNVVGEQTDITISGLQQHFMAAVALLDQVLQHCVPDEKALAEFKSRLEKARANAKLSKTNVARALLNYAVYGPHNPYNNQLSDAQLNSLTAGELTGLLHHMFDYDHTICYYGPMPLAALEIIIKKSHSIASHLLPGMAEQSFVQVDQTQNTILFADYDMVQAELYWIRNTTTYDPGQSATVHVFNNYFGGSMGSLVFQTIRESEALAYSTYDQYSTPSSRNDRYTNVAYVGSQADKLPEAAVSMNALLDSLPNNAKLLADAKAGVRQDIATGRIRPETFIPNYLDAQRMGLKGDHRRDIYDMAERIDFHTLQMLHDDQLKNRPYTYCLVASDQKVQESELARFGAVHRVGLTELFGY